MITWDVNFEQLQIILYAAVRMEFAGDVRVQERLVGNRLEVEVTAAVAEQFPYDTPYWISRRTYLKGHAYIDLYLLGYGYDETRWRYMCEQVARRARASLEREISERFLGKGRAASWSKAA